MFKIMYPISWNGFKVFEPDELKKRLLPAISNYYRCEEDEEHMQR
jgi:hypothetical protein